MDNHLIDDSILNAAPLPSKVDILVVGAGPTGLGAASRLTQLGRESWVLVEATAISGGLARTEKTPEGFYFDMGGHVTFSHYSYFDQLVDAAVGTGDEHWNNIQRVSFVWVKNTFVPYPFQNNLYCLPNEDKIVCLNGLIDTISTNAHSNRSPTETTFDEWILTRMGEGIANIFMRPYNFKVWAYPTTVMQSQWLGERVATVDLKRVIKNVVLNQADEGWGPNATFKFPKQGGTGTMWTSVAEKLIPVDKLVYGTCLVGVDFANRIAHFHDKSAVAFDHMISTIPLDTMLNWLGRSDLSRQLCYSSTHVIGIGLRGINPHDRKCWMYYPESDCPFYRANIYSAYANSNCPHEQKLLPTIRLAGKKIDAKWSHGDRTNFKSGPYWSILFEVSESHQHKPVNPATIVDETIAGAVRTKLLQPTDEIVSMYYHRLEKGYPTPHVQRDAVLGEALDLLKSYGIYSRGRFGAWKYEVGNQDHSVMQGVEVVDSILSGESEMTLNSPNYVNSRSNTERQYSKH